MYMCWASMCRCQAANLHSSAPTAVAEHSYEIFAICILESTTIGVLYDLWIVSHSNSPSLINKTSKQIQVPYVLLPCRFVCTSQGSHARTTSHTFVAGEATEVTILTSMVWQISRFGILRTFGGPIISVFVISTQQNWGKTKMRCGHLTSQIWETSKFKPFSPTSWDLQPGRPRVQLPWLIPRIRPKGPPQRRPWEEWFRSMLHCILNI
jgi:hypothetical protein